MKPIEFVGQDKLLGPPTGTPRGQCGALPIRVVRCGPFGPELHSYWKPSAEDLAALNRGAHVRLAVHGSSHPPVWIDIKRCEELP